MNQDVTVVLNDNKMSSARGPAGWPTTSTSAG